jgi:hypothetical protein
MEDSIDKLKIEIEASADKAQSSIDVLIEKVEALQGVFKKDLGVKKLMSSLQDLANFQGKIKDIGKDIIPASSLEGLNKQIQGLESSFNKLAIQEENFKLLGKDVNSDSYKKLQIEIARTLNGLETLYQAQERMQAESEQLFVGGIPFEQWYEAKYGAQEAEQAITEAVAQIQSSIGNIDTSPLEGISQAMKGVAQESTATAESIETLSNSSGLSSIGEKLRSIFNGEGFANLTESVRNLQQQLGIRVNTTQYNDLVNQIEKAEAALQKFLDKQDRMEAIGVSQSSQAWKGLQFDIKVATDRVADLKRDLELLEENGKDTRLLSLSEAFKKMSDSTSGLRSAFKKINGAIASVGNKLRSLAKDTKTTQQGFIKLSEVLKPFTKQITKLSTMLKMMLTRMALRNVISNLGTGIQGLAVYSSDFNAKLSELISACKSLAYGISALASPILDIFGPALTYIIDLLSTAVAYVNQFLSALTGKAFYTAAKKNATNYAASLDKVSGSAQKVKSLLAGIDELNILNSNDSSGTSSDTLENMYESLEISQDIKDMAQQIKDLMSDIFNPLKTAWDNVGADVMDSWKYAMNNIKDLAKSIGDDLMTVWKQAETEKIFEDILGIISDIGLVVGNLANNFRLAWEENETGLHILENCRDILAVVVGNIKEAADATVIWSENLDFSPLLQKIEEWTSSLIPVFDFLSGTISDFYTQVLLPLGQWTLEQGLPDLLDVFIGFNNLVDWESLRTELSTLWEHIEPFCETVGEGLVLFIEDVSTALANFVNSQAFKDFLEEVEKWMDSVEAEDVADGLKKICAAIVGFKVVETAITGLTAAKAFINIWTTGKGAQVAGEMSTAATGALTLAKALDSLAATGAAVETFRETIERITFNKSFENLNDSVNNNKDELDKLKASYDNGEISLETYNYKLREITQGTEDLLGEEQKLSDYKVISDFADEHSEALNRMKSDYENGRISISQFKEELELLAEEDTSLTGVNIADGIIQGMKSEGDIGFWDSARYLLDTALDSIWDVFGIGSPAKEMYETGGFITLGVSEGIKQEYDSIQKTLTEFGENIQKWFNNKSYGNVNESTWTDYAKNIVDSFRGKVSGYYGTVQSSVTKWAEKVRSWYTTDGGVNKTKFTGFAKDVIDSFKSKISGYYGNSRASMQNWAKDTTTWFKNLSGTSQWQGLATNIVDGFNNHVGAIYSRCRSTIESWASDIVGWFKDKLDINSPSKVFAELGQYTIAGFNDGLEKASASTSDVMQDWISSFSDMTVNIGVALDVDDSPLSRLGRNGINANMSIEEMADYLNSNLINGNDNYEQMNLMREQNELLQQILDKDISVSGDEVFKVVRKKANEYYRANRKFAFDI